MVSLLDIAPVAHAKVPISGGREVDVFGLPLAAIAEILTDYPALRPVVTGEPIEIDAAALVEAVLCHGPKVVATVIAAGCGAPGDAAARDIAGRLPLEDQVSLLAAIMTATAPGGPGPLVARLASIGLFGRATPPQGDAATEQPDSPASSDS